MSSSHRIKWAVALVLGMFSLLLGIPGESIAATHYPPNANCGDCHATSKSKMYTGTKMLKVTPTTEYLRTKAGNKWTPGTALPCVVCHEQGKSGDQSNYMKPVYQHFDNSVASKHDAEEVSSTASGASTFDCLDCHTNLGGYIVADGAGNASVHGLATGTHKVVTATLVEYNNNGDGLMDTCAATTCHGGAAAMPMGSSGKLAAKAHNYETATQHYNSTNQTLGSTPTPPTFCTDCHAAHRGEKQDKLMVLLADGSKDLQDGSTPAAAYVTPADCEGCHIQDNDPDDSFTNNWTARGHGKPGIALACTICHDATTPHLFNGSNRFLANENTTKTSSLTSKPSYSICLTCHSEQAGKVHDTVGTLQTNIGCLDCHDVHGQNMKHGVVAQNSGYNTAMIRATLRPLSTEIMIFTDPNVKDTTVFADDYWDADASRRANDANGSSVGLCDNATCHANATWAASKEIPEFPMANLVLNTPSHGGGAVSASTPCASCHSHTDTSGSWGAVSSCDGCHSYPPNTNAHVAHLNAGITDCNNCHTSSSAATHNNSSITDKVAYDNLALSNFPALRNQVDVTFAASIHAGGSYSPAKGSRVGTTYNQCSANCHGGSLPVAAQGTDITPAWNTPTTGDCGTCHKASKAVPPTTGSHAVHFANAGRNLVCNNCHANTVAANGTTLGSAHMNGTVDGAQDVLETGTYVGVTINLDYNATTSTCSNLTCHGSYASVVWGAAVDTCSNCHGTFDGTFTGVASGTNMVGVVAKHNESGWSATTPSTNFGNGHKGSATGTGKFEEYCDFCHANTQGTYALGGSSSYNSLRHLNGSVELNTSPAYQQATFGCTSACHAATAPYTMADSTLPIVGISGQTTGCGSCHTSGVSGSSATGAHVAHGASTADMAAQSGADCAICHGATGGYTSAVGGTHGNGTLNWTAGITYTGARGVLTGTCTTTMCHNSGTEPSALWNATPLGCEDCHYWATTPTVSGNGSHARPLSAGHNEHFAKSKLCERCHAAVPGTFAGIDAHINGTGAGETYAQKTVALQDEALVSFSDALAVTDYSFDDANNTCFNKTNNGLGCHATATGATGVPATDPDWDSTIAATDCTKCHTDNTTAAVNPTSGLHGAVTPTITGRLHDETLNATTKCTACHSGMGSETLHINSTLTGDTVADLGLDATINYVQTSANNGTCIASCHKTYSADWRHKWTTTTAYTNATASCSGCHGDWANGWNTGVIHKTSSGASATHGGAGTYRCKDCHTLEAVSGLYAFTFGTNDWGGTSKHGNGSIEVNNNGLSYNASNLCGPTCHTVVDGTHNFADTTWPIANLSGDAINAGCNSCHGGDYATAGNLNYWPGGAGVTWPDRTGVHNIHMTRLSTKLGYAIGSLTDTQQKTMCRYCHTYTTDVGEAGHNDASGPANVGSFDRIFNGAADANATYTPGNGVDGTCANLDCHNSKSTTTTFDWYDAIPASNCTMCHTTGSGTTNPVSGLHNVTPSVSGAIHNETLNATTKCEACHTSMPAYAAAGTHINGTFTGDTMGNMGLSFYTQAAADRGTCLTTGCHKANTDDWAHKWTTTTAYTNATASCSGCHGDWTNGWNTGVTHRTSGGAQSHGGTGTYDCYDCHNLEHASYTFTFGTTDWGGASRHGNASIDINSNGTSYNQTTNLCNGCHTTVDGTHNFVDTTWTISTISGQAIVVSCTSCHAAGGSGQIVTAASSHVRTTKGGAVAACTDCHPGGTRGAMHAKNGDANVVLIPEPVGAAVNQPGTALGIQLTNDHASYAGDNGIVLGGDRTVGTTEAEICWNCHDQNNNGNLDDANDISEWGTNVDTNGTFNNYNFGRITTKSWIGASWSSAFTTATPSFSYKRALIASTHAASTITGAVQGVDAVASIKCTYCHDVHGANLATGDTNTGRPYLRGSWIGNPYREDGAPQRAYSYANTTPWGPVPRGGPTQTAMGGFFIDQNSGTTTSTWTATQFGGLCDLCHGTTRDGAFTATEIDTLNVNGAVGAGWVSGANGHVNSVKGASHNGTATTGGTANTGNNIFTTRGGAASQTTATNSHPFMLFMSTSVPGDNSGGFRASDSQVSYKPAMTNARPTDGGGWSGTQWNVTGTTLNLTGTIVDSNYHRFTCSKCHNPHASRLPALMITNCLDTKQNTWDNSPQLCTVDGPAVNQNRSISNWSSAQNCHRKGGVDPTDTRADTAAPSGATGSNGWNTVTPW